VALLRVLAVVLAASLMVGELWRSWGTDRQLVFVVDDMIIGVLLLAGACAMARDTLRRRALFCAAWAFSAGLLYSSFFGKLVAPAEVDSGNWNMSVLTVLVGLAFVTSVIGVVASTAIPARSAPIQSATCGGSSTR
jgi:hypothetical protein